MAKKFWPISFMLIFINLISSCSSQYYRRPESIQSKMDRFQANQENTNTVPQLDTIPHSFKFKIIKTTSQKKRRRAPASLNGGVNFDLLDMPRNNKQLYFLTLYSQYNTLKGLFPKNFNPKIRHCPSFHTSLLEHKEKFGTIYHKMSLNVSHHFQKLNTHSSAYYPELALPISSKESNIRVIDILKDQSQTRNLGGTRAVITKALSTHLNRTYTELTELCESGYSKNYYTYENLSTHIRNQGQHFSPSNKNMSVLLKTTLFSNWALIKSLTHQSHTRHIRRPASQASSSTRAYGEAISHKLNIPWAKAYFEVMIRLRK